jgi:hypothetical protein
MKYCLLLLGLTAPVISAMDFTQVLEAECVRARHKNTQIREFYAQRALKECLEGSHIPKFDRETIEAKYKRCTSITKVMCNNVFNAYLVQYTDEQNRHMQDFINCLKSQAGSLVVISINVIS